MRGIQAMSPEEENALRELESFGEIQTDETVSTFPCPRCGHYRMRSRVVDNALSRHAKVYICPECGTDEALRDMIGQALSPTEWGMVLSQEESEDEG